MRPLFYVLPLAAVIALAFFAYREHYRTTDALAELARTEAEIARLGEALAVQRAEWAYLNRPERLRELADLNFDRLGLLPMEAARFGRIDQVAYPAPEAPAPALTGVTETIAAGEEEPL